MSKTYHAGKCKNCGTGLQGKFCYACGEKVYTDHDKSIIHFFEDAFHFITHFEGTFFNTLKAIATRPGLLSLEYCRGVRKKYFKPLSFFMMLVILYLLFPMFEGLNMKLRYYPAQPLYGEWTRQVIDAKMTKLNIDFETLSELYAKKSEKFSKVLLLTVIPMAGVVLWILFAGRRKWLVDHLVLSTEINSFFLLLSFLIYPFVIALLNKFLPDYLFSDGGFLINSAYLFVTLYTVIAFRRFYTTGFWGALWRSLLFIVLHMVIVYLLYKFILFATVMLFV